MEAIEKVAPIKKVRAKAYSKPWFDAEIVSEVPKRDKLHWRHKKWGLETGKSDCKTAKIFL